MKRLIILTIGLAGSILLSASNDDCLNLFKRITEEARAQRVSMAKSGFEMNCHVKVTQAAGQIFEDDLKVRLHAKKYHYQSKSITMYLDDRNFVAIQNDSKIIFIAKAQAAVGQKDQFTQALSIMDSLQKHMIFKSCTKEFGTVRKDEGYHKIVFAPSGEIRKAGVDGIVYWLSEAEASVKKILVRYADGNEYGLKEYELIIDKLNYKYQGDVFKGESVGRVLKNNSLLPEFKNFQLVDKRN